MKQMMIFPEHTLLAEALKGSQPSSWMLAASPACAGNCGCCGCGFGMGLLGSFRDCKRRLVTEDAGERAGDFISSQPGSAVGGKAG